MDVGVPGEIRPGEQRVGLTPPGVDALVRAGQRVLVEQGAGRGAGFHDREYAQVGATIVYSTEEVWRRAEVVVKVSRHTAEEYDHLHGQTLLAFLHHTVASPDLLIALRQHEMTAIAAGAIRSEERRVGKEGRSRWA